MGISMRKKQDGTGPYKNSFQRRNFAQGRRKIAGYDCPFDVKESSDKNGGFKL